MSEFGYVVIGENLDGEPYVVDYSFTDSLRLAQQLAADVQPFANGGTVTVCRLVEVEDGER